MAVTKVETEIIASIAMSPTWWVVKTSQFSRWTSVLRHETLKLSFQGL